MDAAFTTNTDNATRISGHMSNAFGYSSGDDVLVLSLSGGTITLGTANDPSRTCSIGAIGETGIYALRYILSNANLIPRPFRTRINLQ